MMYDSPDDFIVSTVKSFSLNYMIEKLFELSGLGDYQNFIRLNNSQIRPNEIRACYLNPSKIEKLLNKDSKWREGLVLVEKLKEKRNSASKQISIYKKENKPADHLISEMKNVS